MTTSLTLNIDFFIQFLSLESQHSLIWKITDFLFCFFPFLCAFLMDMCTCVQQCMSSESWWIVQWRAKSMRLCTPGLYISIHLLLMQQTQLWGSGTLCWRPNESWVIYHVESHSSSLTRMLYTTPFRFFYTCFPSIFCNSFILICQLFAFFIFLVLLEHFIFSLLFSNLTDHMDHLSWPI